MAADLGRCQRSGPEADARSAEPTEGARELRAIGTTLTRLREIPALTRTPVIFMTAKVQPQEVAALYALGMLGVIAKPFDPMQLASKVSAIWEDHHG